VLIEGCGGAEGAVIASNVDVTGEEIVEDSDAQSNAVTCRADGRRHALVPGGAISPSPRRILARRQRFYIGLGTDRAHPRSFLAWMKEKCSNRGPEVLPRRPPARGAARIELPETDVENLRAAR